MTRMTSRPGGTGARRAPMMAIGALALLVAGLTGCESADTTGPADALSGTDATASGRGPGGRGSAGLVFASTNAASGNEVVAFSRTAHGALTHAGSFATGGAGAGSGLGSQGALRTDGRFVYVVNAGSSTISSFSVHRDGLTLVDQVASGGTMPISLTVHGRLLYALNAGDGGNIAGFRVDRGRLTPLAGSTQPLSGNPTAGPAQIEFSPDGGTLVVTEKATSLIDTYEVGRDGMAGPPDVQASHGTTPFGFAFNRKKQIIVSEAFVGPAGAAPGGSAVSSYELSRAADLSVVSGSVADGQTAACWVVVTGNHKYAYVTNTQSGTVSSYGIGHTGALTLLDQAAGSTGPGSTPIDMALSRNSRILYVLSGSTGDISAFEVQSDGSLSLAGVTSGEGLSAGAAGIGAQ